jgi:hypothetical protein
MLPLSELKSPIRIELFLSAKDDAIIYYTLAAGASWQIVNFEMELCLVEIDSPSPINEPNKSIYISTRSFRQASSTLTATQTGEWTVLLPFRFFQLQRFLQDLEIMQVQFKEQMPQQHTGYHLLLIQI